MRMEWLPYVLVTLRYLQRDKIFLSADLSAADSPACFLETDIVLLFTVKSIFASLNVPHHPSALKHIKKRCGQWREKKMQILCVPLVHHLRGERTGALI